MINSYLECGLKANYQVDTAQRVTRANGWGWLTGGRLI